MRPPRHLPGRTLPVALLVASALAAGGCDEVRTPTPTDPVTLSPDVTPRASVMATETEGEEVALPAFDIEVEEVDLCAAVDGLCDAVAACPDESVVGPSSVKKGIGFALEGCGNLTKLRVVSGNLAMDGVLRLGDVGVDAGSADIDPGCREDVITIPGRPAVPAVPAITTRTGRVVYPGRPGRPARPAREIVVRTPEGCEDPLRPPSADFTEPSFTGFTAHVQQRLRGELVVEAAGTGQIELRIPIPGAGKVVYLPAGVALQHPHTVKMGVRAHLYLKGALSEAGARFTAVVDEETAVDYELDPERGWDIQRRTVSTDRTAEVETFAPDTARLVWGILPAVAFLAQPLLPADFFEAGFTNNAFLVEFGHWELLFYPYTITQISSGARKIDADAGVEAGVYGAAYRFKQDIEQWEDELEDCDPTDPDCTFATIPVDTTGGEFFRSFRCCVVDMYDQYGIGQLRFAATTTGEAIDWDPNGYALTWRRASNTPEPYVDSVMTRVIEPDGVVHYPEMIEGTPSCDAGDQVQPRDGSCDPPANLPTRAFDLIPKTVCEELYSDAPIAVSPGTLVFVDVLRRHDLGPPAFSKIIGCQQLPADYTLEVSGLAINCTVTGENPRDLRLRPLLNLPQRVGLPPGTGWPEVIDVTDVELAVHCRPLVGDLRVVAATEGVDPDPDGYALSVDDAVKGRVEGRVSVNGEELLEDLRVGVHTLSLGDVAFNCTLEGAAGRSVDILFERTVEEGMVVGCVSVYDALCAVAEEMLAEAAIANRGIANSLCSELRAADAARHRGNRGAVEGQMGAFVHQVRALSGRRIDEAAARQLLGHAEFIEANGFYVP